MPPPPKPKVPAPPAQQKRPATPSGQLPLRPGTPAGGAPKPPPTGTAKPPPAGTAKPPPAAAAVTKGLPTRLSTPDKIPHTTWTPVAELKKFIPKEVKSAPVRPPPPPGQLFDWNYRKAAPVK
jgi:hypothetical protein